MDMASTYINDLWMDSLLDDFPDDLAIEANYNSYKNRDTKEKSYYANVGKKEFAGSIGPDSGKMDKLAFYIKRMWVKTIATIANFFKGIKNIVREMLRVFLLPLSAASASITKDIPKHISMLSKEDKSIIDWAKREGENKIQTPSRKIFHSLESRIEEALTLSTNVVTLTNHVLSRGVDYSLGGQDKSAFDSVKSDLQKLQARFSLDKNDIDKMKNRIDDTRQQMTEKLNRVSSAYFRKRAVEYYTTIPQKEVHYLIDKMKQVEKISSQHEDICSRLMKSTKVSKDATDVAKTYMDVASICSNIIMNLKSFMSKFNIKAA